MNQKEIENLIQERGLDVYDVIDAVVELNGLVGVGLITLGDNLKSYCNRLIKYPSEEQMLNE